MQSRYPFANVGSAQRRAREAAGLTQQEAAARLGSRQNQLSLYETGAREAPISFLQRAEMVYGESVLALISPNEVPRETATAVRESPPARYGATKPAADWKETLLRIEQMSLAVADIARRAREGAE